MGNIYKQGSPGIIAGGGSASEVIAAPGAGKHILITDIFAHDDTTLSTATAGGGTVLVRMPANAVANMSSPILVPVNQPVHSTANNCSMIYHIFDSNII